MPDDDQWKVIERPQAQPQAGQATASGGEELWRKISSAEKPSTSRGAALWQGLLRGGRDVLEGGAQIGARMGSEFGEVQPGELTPRVDQAARQSQQAYGQNPAAQAHPWIAGGGRIAGNVLGTEAMMPLPGGLGAGVARLGARMLPEMGARAAPAVARAAAGAGLPTGAGLVARGAGTGAAGAAMQPATGQDFWGEKMRQVQAGATVGGAVPGIGGMLAPRLPNPGVITSGVSRAFRPLANFLMGAEERTQEGFDRTIARQVLEPIGGNVEGRISGFKLNDLVKSQVDSAYDRVLPRLQLSDNAFYAPHKGRDDAVAALLPEEAKTYSSILKRALPTDFDLKGFMTGPEFREARTHIAEQGYKFIGTLKHDIGEALIQTANHMTTAVIRENPRFGPELQKAGDAYKLWMRMAAAASKPGAGGKFTPKDLLQAIGSQESNAKIATGEGVLQGYAQAAHDAMGGDKRMSIMDLMHVFARHGLPADMYRGLAGPVGRRIKDVTPFAAPGMGAVEGRRRDTLTEALPSVGGP